MITKGTQWTLMQYYIALKNHAVKTATDMGCFLAIPCGRQDLSS